MPVTERERHAVAEDAHDEANEAPSTETATIHGPRGAYRIDCVRGRGGFGTTYVATREGSAERVLLKELSLARAESWKTVELFEREAAVLARLSHPGIPRFIDAFVADDEGTARTLLVQELVDGPTLEERVRQGGPISAREATHLLTSLTEILEVLHSQDPPIVHRDVTPANIVRAPDGRARLVDFGAAQDRAPKSGGGSTMVGTAGYVPPEQLMGQARPASDLYALGMTIVFALTGRDPASLPIDETAGGVQLGDALNGVPPALADTLQRMTAPALARRLATAEAVRKTLAERVTRGPLVPVLLALFALSAIGAATLFIRARPTPAIPPPDSREEVVLVPTETPRATSEVPFRQVFPMPLSERTAERVVAEAAPRLRRECWDGVPTRLTEAKVAASLRVEPSGDVSRVDLTGPDDALNACVQRNLGALKFPASDRAGTITVPFRFVRAGTAPSNSGGSPR